MIYTLVNFLLFQLTAILEVTHLRYLNNKYQEMQMHQHSSHKTMSQKIIV